VERAATWNASCDVAGDEHCDAAAVVVVVVAAAAADAAMLRTIHATPPTGMPMTMALA